MSKGKIRFCITNPRSIYGGKFFGNKNETFKDLRIIKYSLTLLNAQALSSLYASQHFFSADSILQDYYKNIIDDSNAALVMLADKRYNQRIRLKKKQKWTRQIKLNKNPQTNIHGWS